jgi:hypothetical protein
MSCYIDYHDGTFSAFTLGGRSELLMNGWAFGFHSGGPCTYYTRLILAVRFAEELGFTMSPEANAAMLTHAHDDAWAAEQEVKREKKNAADKAAKDKWYREKFVLVASAKAKLTPEEFDAVLEEGRE